jgi:hypothetical protein
MSPAPHHTRLLMPAVRNTSLAQHWLGLPLHFHLVQDLLQINGYQMYAVEKWYLSFQHKPHICSLLSQRIVERNRPVIVLAVYTGDPAHKARLLPFYSPSLKPSPDHRRCSCSPPHSLLHRSSNRMGQSYQPSPSRRCQTKRSNPPLLLSLSLAHYTTKTPHGTLMATSLAHFRSDYAIVHIPHGNFLAVREQLYTNINLLRMGCSGRTALTLEDPRYAYVSLSHLPSNQIQRRHQRQVHQHLPSTRDHCLIWYLFRLSPSPSFNKALPFTVQLSSQLCSQLSCVPNQRPFSCNARLQNTKGR